MKKLLILSIVLLLVLCSCATVDKNQENNVSSPISFFGKNDEIVVSGTPEAVLGQDIPTVKRITVVTDNNQIHGFIEGVFTKFILNTVLEKKNILIAGTKSLNWYYFAVGKAFFTTSGNAELFYKTRIKENQKYIGNTELKEILKSDFSVFATNINIGYGVAERFLLNAEDDSFSINLNTATESKTKSLFRLLRSDYNTFRIKNGVKQDSVYSEMEKYFSINGSSISITNLPLKTGYLDYWKRRVIKDGRI